MIDHTDYQERAYDALLAREEANGDRIGSVHERLESDALDVLTGKREFVDCAWNHYGAPSKRAEGFMAVVDESLGFEIHSAFLKSAFKAAFEGKDDVCAALLKALAEKLATRWADDYAEAVADAERP